MVSGAQRAADEAIKQEIARLEQVVHNNEQALQKAKVTSFGSSSIRRKTITRYESQASRARAALERIRGLPENTNPRVTQQISRAAQLTDSQLKQQRQNRSAGVSSPSPTGNNFDQGFTAESKSLGFSTTGKAEDARRAEIKQIQREQAIRNSPRAENTGTGSTSDPFKATQPNQKLVSPLLTINKARNQQLGSSQVQGPLKPVSLPSVIQTAFYTRDETQGPPEEVKTPVGSLSYLYGVSLSPADKFIGKLASDIDVTQKKEKFVVAPLLEFPKEVIVGIGSLRNLGVQGYEYLTGKSAGLDEIKLPKTGFDAYLEGIGKPVAEGTNIEKVFNQLIKGEKTESLQVTDQKKLDNLGPSLQSSLYGYGKEYGGGALVSSSAALAAMVPRRVIPLTISELAVPVGKTSARVGGRLTFGYGKISKPVVTIIGKSVRPGKGKSIYKNLENTSFVDISPTGRGFEFLTLNKANADVLASDTALNILERIGKITPLGRKFINLEKEAVGLIDDIKVKPKQQNPLITAEDEVSEALESGKETKVFVEDILPKLLGFKGSQAQRIQVRTKFLAGTGREGLSDFDIDYGNAIFGNIRAKRATTRAARLLQSAAGPDRRFVSTGTKLFSVTLDKEGFVFVGGKRRKFDVLPRKEQKQIARQLDNKVFELLTKKDATSPSGSPSTQNLGQVGGLKYPKDQFNILSPEGKKIKVKGLRFQVLTKIAGSAALQGPLGDKYKGVDVPKFFKGSREEFLKLESNFGVRPFFPRLKDVVDQPFLFKELGTQGIESGKYGTQGKRLLQISDEIKESFPYVDFGKPSGSVLVRSDTPFIDSIGSSVKSFSKGSAKPRPVRETKTKPSENIISQPQSVSKSPSILSLSNVLESIPGSTTSKFRIQSTGYSPSNNIRYPSLFSSKSPSGSPSKSPSKSPVKSPSKSPSKTPSITPSISPSFGPSPSSSPGKSPVRAPSGLRPKPIDLNITQPRQLPRYKPFALKFKFDQIKSRKLPSASKRKFFIADVADPQRAGVFAPKGVKKLISSDPIIFKKIDVNLAKARRKKKAFDPLAGLKISKDGKYTYSAKNLLGSYTKFKI